MDAGGAEVGLQPGQHAESGSVRRERTKFRIGLCLMVVFLAVCVFQNELYAFIESGSSSSAKFNKPYFIVCWNHIWMCGVFPFVLPYLAFFADYTEEGSGALLANDPRPSPGLGRITWYLRCHGLTWRKVLWTGTWTGAMFLGFNYLWFIGLPMKGMIPSEASATANSAFAFVYLFSIPLLKERVDAIKGVAVALCMAGVIALAIGASGGKHFGISAGILVEAACAVGQALYFVAFRKWGIREGALPASIAILIAGFDGLAHLLFFWPWFVVLDVTKWSVFELPDAHTLGMLTLGASTASIGNVCLMAGLALLPGALIVSLASLVTTPLQFIADLFLHSTKAKAVDGYTIVGGVLVMISFGVVIWRDHMLLRAIKK